MSTRRFHIQITGEVVLDIDDAVFAAVDDDWRRHLYDLTTPEEIAGHIGYNYIANGWRLSSLDGFAGMPDSHASVVPRSEGWSDCDAREVAKPKATPKRGRKAVPQ